MEILKACPLCHSDKIKFVLKTKDFTYPKKNEYFTFSQCRDCQAIFQSKRPSVNQIKDYYQEDYQPYKDDYSILVRWFIKLRTLLEIKKYNRLLKNKDSPGGVKVLEIGCARGKYIKSLRDWGGYQVIGVEIDKKSSEYAQKEHNLEVRCGELLSQNFPANNFDIVIMNHVLEHLYNPLETLKEVHRILRPRGLLLVRTPDSDVIERKLFGKYWSPYEAPRHIILFSKSILRKILSSLDFRFIEVSNEKSPNNIILSIKNYLIDKELSKKIINFFSINNYLLLMLFLPFSFLLGLFRQSGRLTLICYK